MLKTTFSLYSPPTPKWPIISSSTESTLIENDSVQENTLLSFSSFSAINVRNSDITPQNAEVPMIYALNAANIIQPLDVTAKSTNARAVSKNIQHIMNNVPRKSVQSQTISAANVMIQDILMNNQNIRKTTQTIAILQYNLNKNRSTTYSVLNDPISSKYAILLLQEQYTSKLTNSSLTHRSWELFESKSMENNPPRAAIYLNKTILSAHSYEIIVMEISDMMVIAV